MPRWDRGKWTKGYIGDLLLPEVEAPDKDSSAADWGTALHAVKAGDRSVIFTGLDNKKPVTTIMAEMLSEEDVARLWPSRLGKHEQAYSYNCKTHEVEEGPCNEAVEVMNAWKESRAAECVVGTTDWDANLPTGEPWNDDLKTGWQKPDVDTEPMLFYGLCKQRLSKYAPGTGRLSVTHRPRTAPVGDSPERYWLQVGPLQWDAFAEELEVAWRRVRSGLEVVRAGPHCEYCPSVYECPKHKGV